MNSITSTPFPHSQNRTRKGKKKKNHILLFSLQNLLIPGFLAQLSNHNKVTSLPFLSKINFSVEKVHLFIYCEQPQSTQKHSQQSRSGIQDYLCIDFQLGSKVRNFLPPLFPSCPLIQEEKRKKKKNPKYPDSLLYKLRYLNYF